MARRESRIGLPVIAHPRDYVTANRSTLSATGEVKTFRVIRNKSPVFRLNSCPPPFIRNSSLEWRSSLPPNISFHRVIPINNLHIRLTKLSFLFSRVSSFSSRCEIISARIVNAFLFYSPLPSPPLPGPSNTHSRIVEISRSNFIFFHCYFFSSLRFELRSIVVACCLVVYFA